MFITVEEKCKIMKERGHNTRYWHWLADPDIFGTSCAFRQFCSRPEGYE